jgi:hypothetical protein
MVNVAAEAGLASVYTGQVLGLIIIGGRAGT